MKMLDPITPGEILLEDFMKPLGISVEKLSREINLPTALINDIINGTGVITDETAQKLGKYFRITPGIWTGLQTEYDQRLDKRQSEKPNG